MENASDRELFSDICITRSIANTYPLLLKEKRTDFTVNMVFNASPLCLANHDAHDHSLTTLVFGAGWLRLFWREHWLVNETEVTTLFYEWLKLD